MTELPAQRLLLDAVLVLEEQGISYAVMGGFAVRAWGIPRPTYDVDLAVVVDDHTLQDLLTALDAVGFDVPDEFRRGFVDSIGELRKVKVTRFLDRSVWDVDLFVAQGRFFDAAMPRRRALPLGGRDIQTLAPEDLIALKLLAYRRKDQLDVEEILKVTTEIDEAHLRRQLRLLGIENRLESFLADPDAPR